MEALNHRVVMDASWLYIIALSGFYTFSILNSIFQDKTHTVPVTLINIFIMLQRQAQKYLVDLNTICN